MLMRLRLGPSSQPWHVGLLVYLVMVLTSSLLVAPWVAAELDFGHWHPEDEPAHVHDLTGILTGAATAAQVSVSMALVPFSPISAKPLDRPADGVLDPSRAIRAPPISG